MFSDEWNRRFLNLALEVSTWSKDPTRPVGCVIVNRDKKVRSLGYNGFPSWFDDNAISTFSKTDKSRLITHAEINALDNLPKQYWHEELGLFITIAPCLDCSSYITNTLVNIQNIVYSDEGSIDFRTRHGIDTSLNMLTSKNIKTRYMDINNVCKNLCHSEQNN